MLVGESDPLHEKVMDGWKEITGEFLTDYNDFMDQRTYCTLREKTNIDLRG